MTNSDEIPKLEVFLRTLQQVQEGIPALRMDPATKFAFDLTFRGLEALKKWVETRLAQLQSAAAGTSESIEALCDDAPYPSGFMF